MHVFLSIFRQDTKQKGMYTQDDLSVMPLIDTTDIFIILVEFFWKITSIWLNVKWYEVEQYNVFV